MFRKLCLSLLMSHFIYAAEEIQILDSTSATGLFANHMGAHGDYFIAGSENSTAVYDSTEYQYGGLTFIYQFDSNTNSWDELSPLASSLSSSQPRLGKSVDMVDSTTITCGVFYGSLNGACAIFSLQEDGSWEETGLLIDSVYNSSQLGHDVALSPESDFAVVATGYDEPIVWINDGFWNIHQRLTIDDTLSSDNYWSVKANDELIIVQDSYYQFTYEDSLYYKPSVFFVFQKSSSNDFNLIQQIFPVFNDRVTPIQGGFDLYENTMVMGIRDEGVPKVAVLEFIEGQFELVQLIENNQANDFYSFGATLALDRGRLIIGSRGESFDSTQTDSINNAGRIYVYEQNASGQFEEVSLLELPTRSEYDQFGSEIVLTDRHLISRTITNNIQLAFYKLDFIEESTTSIQNYSNSSSQLSLSKLGWHITSEKPISSYQWVSPKGQVLHQSQLDDAKEFFTHRPHPLGRLVVYYSQGGVEHIQIPQELN